MGATPGKSGKIEVLADKPKNPSLGDSPFPAEKEYDRNDQVRNRENPADTIVASQKDIPGSLSSLRQLLIERAKNIFDFKKEKPELKDPGFVRDVFLAKQEGIRNRLALVQRIQLEHPELMQQAA
jgi:hypothetical protein